LLNDAPFGLAAAVKAGIVWLNDHHRLDPASLWGGDDDSGIGRELLPTQECIITFGSW
jgi:acyl-CoA reductase-like NAD-dependent aldehyde dehydrogenase